MRSRWWHRTTKLKPLFAQCHTNRSYVDLTTLYGSNMIKYLILVRIPMKFKLQIYLIVLVIFLAYFNLISMGKTWR